MTNFHRIRMNKGLGISEISRKTGLPRQSLTNHDKEGSHFSDNYSEYAIKVAECLGVELFQGDGEDGLLGLDNLRILPRNKKDIDQIISLLKSLPEYGQD